MSLINTAIAVNPVDIVGMWADIGACKTTVLSFESTGFVGYYEWRGGRYAPQGIQSWWVDGNSIYIGQKSPEVLVAGIVVTGLTPILMSGSMILSDNLVTPFIWERCVF